MSYPPFKECRLATMTMVIMLEGSVFLDEAFSLLPITEVDMQQPKRQKKKYQLPHCDKPGSIISMRYKGVVRGIFINKFFKNSIIIDLSTKDKNVSIKLSKTKIHMCGASSKEMAIEGATYLINELLEIQKTLNYIHGNPDKCKETKEWILKSIKGELVEKPIYKIIKRSTFLEDKIQHWDEEVFSHMEKDFSLVSPDIEKSPDKKIAELFLRQLNEFKYYNDFVPEIDWILGIKNVVTENIAIENVLKVMVNYNYNLGFSVDRGALHDLMVDRGNFISTYDNCVEHCVKIKLPYLLENEKIYTRRKKKVPSHCFLIYKSGVVTQTGPCEEKMEEAYILFRNCIEEIKSKIILKEDPQNIL